MVDLQTFVAEQAIEHGACVQPRMGLSDLRAMVRGLERTAVACPNSVCTITLDSFTRVGDFDGAARALCSGLPLNGFPIVTHESSEVRQVIEHIARDFGKPIQVRHGSPQPIAIFERLAEVGVLASEGGPISYCLPYGNVSLRETLAAWKLSVETFAQGRPGAHIESFAGCMLGQLCPPSLLIALNVIEGLFFRQHGLRSMSFSYAQGTSCTQDAAALHALRIVAKRYLPDVRSHVVFYMYMGIFPETVIGALQLMGDGVRTVKAAGVERIIVKTPAEASRIPTVEENIASIEYARQLLDVIGSSESMAADLEEETTLLVEECVAIIESVLAGADDIVEAVLRAFASGRLDVPYCIHRDNAGVSRSTIDERGFLTWATPGRMCVRHVHLPSRRAGSAEQLKSNLQFMRRKYDRSPMAPCVS